MNFDEAKKSNWIPWGKVYPEVRCGRNIIPVLLKEFREGEDYCIRETLHQRLILIRPEVKEQLVEESREHKISYKKRFDAKTFKVYNR